LHFILMTSSGLSPQTNSWLAFPTKPSPKKAKGQIISTGQKF
jgi:hypothetical protein